jgi:hypothetical protein
MTVFLFVYDPTVMKQSGLVKILNRGIFSHSGGLRTPADHWKEQTNGKYTTLEAARWEVYSTSFL